jgi:hypothetical protein
MSDLAIDLSALEKEISGLSDDEIKEQLLQLRTKQRIAQKKYHDPEKARVYRTKRAEGFKLMVARAKAAPATKPGFANLYEQIVAESAEAADSALAAEAASESAE